MSILTSEMQDVMSKKHVLFDVAEKVEYKRDLTAEEKEVAEISDAWAKEIGETGKDPDCQVAAYIKKTVQEEVYNAPDELLDQMFVTVLRLSLMSLKKCRPASAVLREMPGAKSEYFIGV